MAIFFDFDGTLVNVADRFYAVYQTVCQVLGIHQLPKAKYWRARQNRLKTREILALTQGEDSYDHFIAERTCLIEAHKFLHLDTLREGAKELLGYLSCRQKIHLISLRNSRENLVWELENLGILHYFTSIGSASAFGTFEDKANLLAFGSANPQQDLIVGDTESDILAGRTRGIYTCAILNGMRTGTFLASLKPDYTVSELQELISIVEQLSPS